MRNWIRRDQCHVDVGSPPNEAVLGQLREVMSGVSRARPGSPLPSQCDIIHRWCAEQSVLGGVGVSLTNGLTSVSLRAILSLQAVVPQIEAISRGGCGAFARAGTLALYRVERKPAQLLPETTGLSRRGAAVRHSALSQCIVPQGCHCQSNLMAQQS